MGFPSSATSMKLKTLIRALITSPVHRFLRAVSEAKAVIIQCSKQNQHKLIMFYHKRASKRHKKFFLGSFRLHYNWCSSHVLPTPVPNRDTKNSAFSMDAEICRSHGGGEGLSGYLEWLEDKVSEDQIQIDGDDGKYANEIDRLAEMFIASCHEKFLIEKVESYRMFQEMLARGLW